MNFQAVSGLNLDLPPGLLKNPTKNTDEQPFCQKSPSGLISHTCIIGPNSNRPCSLGGVKPPIIEPPLRPKPLPLKPVSLMPKPKIKSIFSLCF